MKDKEHLKLSLEWLLKAQKVTSDGGVSQYYQADKKAWWKKSYPETTGYIIPTFLNYYKYFDNEIYKNKAIEMGDWELDIQSPDGGTGDFIGFYATNTLKPRNFNTGQVMLGYLSLFEYTKDKKYLSSCVRSADYIIDSLNSEGTWNYSRFNTPQSYNVRVAWPVLELSLVLQSEKYKFYGELMTNWVISKGTQNGWFKKNNFSKDEKGLTHLIGYTLVGLLKIYHIKNLNLNYEYILEILVKAAENLCKSYLKKINSRLNKESYVGFAAYYDANWNELVKWSCTTGDTQIEYFLRDLGNITSNKIFLETADIISNEMKNIHITDDIANDNNLIGGLFGSYPIEKNYHPYEIPNQGIKFFADSLLQKMYINDKINYIG